MPRSEARAAPKTAGGGAPHRSMAARVQCHHPWPAYGKPRRLDLPLARVHPLIRIAHHLRGPVGLAHRIIYDHELILVLDGEGETVLGDERWPYRPGTLICIPPFLPHRQTCLSGRRGEHIAVHFDWADGLPGHAADPRRRRPYRVHVDGFPDPPFCRDDPGTGLCRALQRVVDLHGSDDPRDRLKQALHLSEILLRLAEADPGADVGDPRRDALWRRLRPAFARIQHDYAAHLAVAGLAAACGLSRSRFAELFRRLAGRSVMDYVRRYRVDRARDLLADEALNLEAVAEACGFADAFHLSRVFHRIDGRSPSAYREELRVGTAGRAC